MTIADQNGKSRRSELAAFLRSRRERITPADVGLLPGLRRRTPGLRREEVAQLAGVGVTWYTWLEQGRPINASVQVLDAVARTLRLDKAEAEHLYRLADVPALPVADTGDQLEPEIQVVLDKLSPLPAAIYTGRYDLLAWNQGYAAFFPFLTGAAPAERNALWAAFTARECCTPFVNVDAELPNMVATFRAAFGRHVGEPAWTEFVRRLSEASPVFARMWASHDVADPGTRMKLFRHSTIGLVRMSSTSLGVSGRPETRLVIYTPLDDDSRTRLTWLLDNPLDWPAEHTH